jgi:hypothetical protein
MAHSRAAHHQRRGTRRVMGHRWTEAARDFDSNIHLDPLRARGWQLRALARSHIGEDAGAALDSRVALELDTERLASVYSQVLPPISTRGDYCHLPTLRRRQVTLEERWLGVLVDLLPAARNFRAREDQRASARYQEAERARGKLRLQEEERARGAEEGRYHAELRTVPRD